jgi:O-acetyl-ADP-ribose deacetylase (regulator of RNase III)
MRIVEGDLIGLALAGQFDVIAHGCNCFCKQKSGIAKEMVKYFLTNTAHLEEEDFKGDYLRKMGNIEVCTRYIVKGRLEVVNCYTQYKYGGNHADGDPDPFDSEAIKMCLKKLAHKFKGKKIGLPYIGCGLASPEDEREGRKNWFESAVRKIMYECDVTLVKFKK